MSDRCKTCRFWDGQWDRGECRRHAPIAGETGSRYEFRAVFPHTKDTDWCGDHERKPEEERKQ